MKIWFDSFLYLNDIRERYVGHIENFPRGEYECDPAPSIPSGDCYGVWSRYNTWTHFLPGQEYLSYVAEHRLQLANTLHIQPCDASHWLICNPIDAGNIAVIDEEALSLLGNFHMPTTLREGIVRRDASITHLLPIIYIFLNLRFLYDLDQEGVASSEQSGASTLSAWLHISNACNLACHYCYIPKSADHMEKNTSRQAVDAVIRSAVRHSYTGIHLKYAGGEAMLKLPQVIATHDYAQQQAQEHDLRLSASLLSNGTIMTQQMIAQLKERRIHVVISLDGIGAAHDQQRPYASGAKGSFAMVDRTISRLLASGLRPSINVTVSQRNIAGLPMLLAYILERDLHFTLSYYRENDCSASIIDLQFSEEQMIDGMSTAFTYIENHLPRRRIIDSLIDKGDMRAPHHYTCGIGRDYLVINQRGEVAKCQADITRTITTIQADDPLHAIRIEPTGMQAIDVDDKEGCNTCTWRYWCGGGCPLVTYRATGRNDLRSPNCAIYKALYPQAVRLEALRLLTYETPIVFENPFSEVNLIRR